MVSHFQGFAERPPTRPCCYPRSRYTNRDWGEYQAGWLPTRDFIPASRRKLRKRWGCRGSRCPTGIRRGRAETSSSPALVSWRAKVEDRLRGPHQHPQTETRAAPPPVSRIRRHGALGGARRDCG